MGDLTKATFISDKYHLCQFVQDSTIKIGDHPTLGVGNGFLKVWDFQREWREEANTANISGFICVIRSLEKFALIVFPRLL